MEKTKNKMTLFTDHLDKQYGQKGTAKIYEKEFETFKLSVMLQELRKEKVLTQQ